MNKEPHQLRRLPQRGHYDRETIYAILDAAKVCHVGFVEDDRPFVIPMLYARAGDEVLLHGAPASRLMKHIAAGRPLCISVAILDGLVLAKSVFHHSVNYRSVVLFGRGRPIEDPEEKLTALRILTEHLTPGRWGAARPPNAAELNATAVVAVAIENASAKVRSGPPADSAEDQALPVWAGVVPVYETLGEPIPATYSDTGSATAAPDV
ncbi:MAG: pyridoxamine 5'-phosphate oxidase family protein [Anaerolineae bacterium]|nr:pyridoxamine 5'-phosphate oxidase family protein [Anaerolineae bacterium]